ncbi:MAG: cob(I)yrinic acid a,c-diamide adenosyltransferase [Candidatus Roizmanbacteria bacterium]|nr:MAG: cob(I)yrinic acid a,c-diamide adenosyltransferase [Candidatus Roizmanbacteria bacterium]
MTIYTKTGDKGKTSLFGGKRVLKCDCNIEAYGSIDELSSIIGLIISKEKNKDKKQLLTDVQKDFYQIMSSISGANVNLASLLKKINFFEQEIKNIELRLPVLNRFILPGGTEIAALLHISRTVCRRAERDVARYFETEKKDHKIQNYKSFILPYLNRLSDLLFIMAREANKNNEVTV